MTTPIQQRLRKKIYKRLNEFSRFVPSMIYQFRLRPDGSSCFPYSSGAIEKIYRVTAKEVQKDSSKVFANLHPEDYAGVVESIQRSANDLTLWDYEYRVKFEDGTQRWLLGNSMPEKLKDGSVLWHGVITDITERKRLEEIVNDRMRGLVASMDSSTMALEALVNCDELQRIQDEFSTKYGVASIITYPDGTPFTVPSNFTQLCGEVISKTETGCSNCYKSAAIIGRDHSDSAIVSTCASGGLFDAATSITVGGHYIANWMIGQVRDLNHLQSELSMREYAKAIGADEQTFMEAFAKVPKMEKSQFKKISDELFIVANKLPLNVFHNPQEAIFLTKQKQNEKLEKFRSDTLEILAKGASLSKILEALVLGVEEVDLHIICGILLLDSDGKHLSGSVAPHLPDFYNDVINGIEIGLGVGSCGTAAFTGERVIVEDIQTHPYWAPYKELAGQAGLAACWSQPILALDKSILGTFTIYHRNPQAPDANYIHIIEQAANIACIAIVHKQTEEALRRSEAQFQQLAFFDVLTGLSNRRMFSDRLSQAMAVSKRSGFYGAVMFLDLDNFKSLNDLHGHNIGDLLLIEVAKRLRTCLREIDIVARFGGDEFVVMLSELHTKKEHATKLASDVAEKIRISLGEPYVLSIRVDGGITHVEHHFTASIGVVLFIGNAASEDELLFQGDKAMYKAKDAGRNVIRVY